MSQVTVVARFTVKPGHEGRVQEGLGELIRHSHDEAGCIAYTLHRDRNDPQTFMMIERWTSHIALESHLQQPYVAAIGPLAQESLAEPPQINIVEPIPVGDPAKGVL